MSPKTSPGERQSRELKETHQMNGRRAKKLRKVHRQHYARSMTYRQLKADYTRGGKSLSRPYRYGRSHYRGREPKRGVVRLTAERMSREEDRHAGAWVDVVRAFGAKLGSGEVAKLRRDVEKGLEIPRGQFNYIRHLWRKNAVAS
jgi:hypothetical protein